MDMDIGIDTYIDVYIYREIELCIAIDLDRQI